MYSNASQQEKAGAMEYLENFQKSKESWGVCHKHLLEDEADVNNTMNTIQIKLFLSQTLRNKLTYDLGQISDNNLQELKDMIIQLLMKYNQKPYKLIRIQLNICLCQLILQDVTWENPLKDLIEFFINNKLMEILFEFLKILPEEINDINKTHLTEEEFNQRVNLIMNESNIEQIFMILSNFIDGNEILILDCLVNWIKELPIESFLKIDSLTNLIFNSLNNDESFEKAVDCLVTIVRETRDIENFEIINALLVKLIELNQFVTIDEENFEILGKLYIESCESWHVLIAKRPNEFKPLVEILLHYLSLDEGLNIIHYSFYFWYLLKQLLTLHTFEQSKSLFVPVYEQLIKIILKLLTYPDDENFDGDKEQEDKFKEFRYDMGDILKDSTVIVGPFKALSIPFEQLKVINSNSYKWQTIESALFSMRTMAKEIPNSESKILPQIMNFLIQLPEHPKIRYSATLVLGRYTEWTNSNPKYLEIQLNYIIKGFNVDNSFSDKDKKPILVASSNALMYFCQDCSKLLMNYLEQLYMLYNEINDKIDLESNYELMDGICHILKNFSENDPKLYETSLLFLNPIIDRLNNKLFKSTDFEQIGGHFELLSIFIKILKIRDYDNYDNKAVEIYLNFILPVANKYLNEYVNNLLVNEKILKVIKISMESFNIYLLDSLQSILHLLLEGFKVNKFGCYLYVSGTILKVFGDEESFEPQLIETIFKFGVEQCLQFFELLKNVADFNAIPDIIEDFFRMLDDLLMYYPNQFFDVSDDNLIIQPSIECSMGLIESLENFESLISIIHYLIDLFSWGSSTIPLSFVEIRNEPLIKSKILSTIQAKGENILQKLIYNLLFRFNNFHNDTITYEINDLILKLIVLSPNELILGWLNNILSNLPNNDIKQLNKFNSSIEFAVQNKDQKRIRTSLKDYINWYTRKNINTRSTI